jgi:hypothetical protein
MNKVRFLAVFLVAFAIALVLWRVFDVTRWYTAGLLGVAGFLGPILHGWVLETTAGRPVWLRGEASVQAALQFDALAIGVVPLLALFVATPGLSLARRCWLMGAGTLVCFLVDAVIVALFPVLVFYTNPVTDVLGTFLGLLGFVGLPFIVWGVLTFRDLRRFLPAFGTDVSPASR